MSTVFIVHGIGGNPEENWFPWMKKHIEKAGHRVIVPAFPKSDEPNFGEWLEHMEKYDDSIDEETVFVGHSLGGMFILRFLETRKKPIRAIFLVASVTGPTDGLEYAPRMTTFTTPPLQIAAIRQYGGSIHLLHADDDPYVALHHAEMLASELGATLEVIPSGKHLNASAGFTTFPQLFTAITSVLTPPHSSDSSVSSDSSGSSVSSL